MRIAVFSDIHGNYEVLDAILNDISKDSFDKVICLGDIISIGPDSAKCLDRLLNSDVKIILGNHDLYFIKGIDKFDTEEEKVQHYRAIFKDIPDKYRDKLALYSLFYDLDYNGFKIRFNHYFIKNIKNIYPFYGIGTIKRMKVKELLNIVDADYTFYGHDHEPSYYVFNNKHLIDVGSSGCIKEDTTFYTIINIDEKIDVQVKKIKYDRDKFVSRLKESSYPLLEHYASGFYGIDDLHS